MKHLFKTNLLALVVIAMAAMCSCSSEKSSDILTRVPADVDFVAVGNLDQLIKNAGFNITNDDIKGPKEFKAELNSIPDRQKEVIGALHSSINWDHMVLMGYFSKELKVTFMAQITDNGRLHETLSDDFYLDGSKVKDMEVFEIDRHDAYLVIKDSYAYLCNAYSEDEAASIVKNFNKHAEEENITSIGSVANVLTQDNILNVAVNTNSLADLAMKYYDYIPTESALAFQAAIPYLKGNWLGLNANYADAELNVEAYLFNEKSGEKVAYPGLKTIDPSVLKYLPSNTILAAATGVNNESVQQMRQQLKGLSDGDQSINELIDQICNVDGTIAIGLGISSEDQLIDFLVNQNMKNLELTLVAQMRSGKAAIFKNYLVNLAQNELGLNTLAIDDVTQLSDGDKFECYLTAKDNNIIVSTKPTVRRSDNDAIRLFNDVKSGIVFTVPKLAKLIGGNSKVGIEGSFVYKDRALKLNVRVLNFGDNIYSAIKDLAPDIINFDNKLSRAWETKYRAMYGSYYDPYDYYDDYDYAVKTTPDSIW